MGSSLPDNLVDQTSMVLSELGLSEYETRAYMSILEGGIVVAREVSDRASIPYAKVYQTLESLSSKRLIIGDEGRPKKFRARDPEDAFQDLLDMMQNNWQEKHNHRKNLVEHTMAEFTTLFEKVRDEVTEEYGIWNINGLANINSRISKLMKKTKQSIKIQSGSPEFISNNLQSSLRNLPSSIMVLLQTPNNFELDTKIQTKVIPELGSATTIFFDDFAYMTIIETVSRKYDSGDYTAVLIQIPEVVKSHMDIFDFLWGV